MSKVWNAETSAQVVQMYKDAKCDNSQLNRIGETFGVSGQAVRGKLSSLGEYVKAETAKPTGAAVVRKGAIVESIATTLGLAADAMPSLESATKTDLETLRGAITNAAFDNFVEDMETAQSEADAPEV